MNDPIVGWQLWILSRAAVFWEAPMCPPLTNLGFYCIFIECYISYVDIRFRGTL